MLIRVEEPKDWAAVFAVNQSAFELPAEARLVDALREQVRPVVSLVAEEDGSILGHILFTPVVLPAHPELKILGLAPMAVAPAWKIREARVWRGGGAGAPRLLPALRFPARSAVRHRV